MDNSPTISNTPDTLVVFADEGSDADFAKALAKHLDSELIFDRAQAERAGLVLRLDEDGLALTCDDLEIRSDFTKMLPRLRKANLQNEMLVRAAKFKGESGTHRAVDATAGLGEDAILLAARGFDVTLFEYDPVIAALLCDGLRRAAKIPELSEIVGRMKLCEADSTVELPRLDCEPDLVLLDPMFPEKHKNALTKKKFQLLHRLRAPCSNEEVLLHAAIQAKPRKIVIKRPLRSAYLAGVEPTFSIKGNAIRYDCIVLAQNNAKEND